ncbi:MAG: peptide chain release factor N(5)-glutamine methyltransferase [Clostridiales bacterium]|nr:peptide chain release factor N(5)-glutamine methyltransferase [Clostridiales bacterium]
MTYREARLQAAGALRAAGIENEAAESGFLMEYACGSDLNFYLLHQGEEMPSDEATRYKKLVADRCRRIPLQHLTGKQEFMGLSFFVNEHVLIPRQDTEVLVEEALKLLHQKCGTGKAAMPPSERSGAEHCVRERIGLPYDPDRRVLDLCTGSGCIAVSLKHFFPELAVCASDISGEALTLARINAVANHTGITFIESDLFSEITERFHMIISNPPYIPSAVIRELMPEVREHEPLRALDGGDDGLAFYRRIIGESPDYLLPGGYLLFEIGSDQGGAVSEMMREKGFADIKVLPDLAGLDRVVRGRYL